MQKMTTRLYTINGEDYLVYFLHAGLQESDRQILIAAGINLTGISATFFRWVKVTDLPDLDAFDNTAFVTAIADAF